MFGFVLFTTVRFLTFTNSFAEPALVAKSNVILDIKPWDDETDMKG